MVRENINVTMPEPAKAVRRFANGDEILGRYVVQSELGQGGMGVVYKCFDKIGGVEVAVKGLPPEVSHNSDEMEAVRENFQLVSELHHQNIAGVRTLEKDSATGDYYLVMTLARGVSLRHWLRQHGGKKHRTEQLNVLRQIASALDYAHNAEPKHIIHRDIKPENIMVDENGRVMVLDFGLAAQVRSSLSRVSQVVTSRSGTPAYKSPEQWLAQAQRAPSDQYSLGVIAYQMFAGELPFDSDDIEILKHAVVFDPVPAISDEGKEVNAVFANVLAKNPQERFGTCEEFVRQLSETLRSSTLVESKANPPCNKKYWFLALCSLLVVAGLLFMFCRPVRKVKLMATTPLPDACVVAGVSNVETTCPSEKSGFARVVSNVDSDSVTNLSATIRKRIVGDRCVEVKLQRVFDSVQVQTLKLWLQSSHGSRVANALMSAKNKIEAEGALLRIVGGSNDGVEKALALCCININEQSMGMFYKSKESIKQNEYYDSLNFLNFKYAMALKDSSSDKEHRKAVELLLGIAFGRSDLSAPALYACSLLAFEEEKYGETASLMRRYIKIFPDGLDANDALALLVLCEFIEDDSPCNKDIAASVRSKFVFAAYDSFTGKADLSSLIQMYLSECPQGKSRDIIKKFHASEPVSQTLKKDDAAPVVATVNQSRHAEKNGGRSSLLRVTTGTNFTSQATVFEKVDEQIIAKEKASVERLLGAKTTTDLTKFVNVAMLVSNVGASRYFKVLITPRNNLRIVPKDLLVMIDGSGSIGKDRFSSCCRTVKQLVRSCMNTGDRFNLVVFRDAFSYAFRSWRGCSDLNYAEGDAWLDRQVVHGRSDLYSAINSVFTLPRDPSRPMIALLVTDGDANAGTSDTMDILSKFTSLNDGLVSLYAYGVKSSGNSRLIRALAHRNRGVCYIFDGWRWNAGEGMGALAERFRDPVLSDLHVVFDKNSNVEAYPRCLRNLYSCETLEIIGRIPASAEELSFELRGLNGCDTYKGDFRIPFEKAVSDSSIIEDWKRETELFSAHEQGDAKETVEVAQRVASALAAFKDHDDAKGMQLVAGIQDADPKIQYYIGTCYFSGRGGVESNEVEAIKWFRKSADQGLAAAQCSLARMYDHGIGVERNATEAADLYRKAAEQGFSPAQCNLGVLYARGRGVRMDVSEAVRWYRKAAEQGNATAQMNLGLMYELGKGVFKDVEEAEKWYSKAAAKGNKEAKAKLIAKSLTK